MGIQRSLAGVKVRDVMEAEPASVSPNETVADLVNERLVRGDGRSFLVRHDDGGLAGHRDASRTCAGSRARTGRMPA